MNKDNPAQNVIISFGMPPPDKVRYNPKTDSMQVLAKTELDAMLTKMQQLQVAKTIEEPVLKSQRKKQLLFSKQAVAKQSYDTSTKKAITANELNQKNKDKVEKKTKMRKK